MRGDDLVAVGLEPGPLFGVALNALPKAVKRLGREQALAELQEVVAAPERHTSHPYFARVALKLIDNLAQAPVAFAERDAPAPFRSWCADAEQGALSQMHNALRLPSAVQGALMPDAHQGYGLPIGGVLATEGTVIPYAVGVDIACRMKLTVLDLPVAVLDEQPALLERALLRETQFGTGATLRERADHEVLDAERWAMTQLVRNAARQGDRRSSARAAPATTSSSSVVSTLAADDLGLEPPARYLALLSHSGSRGPGAQVASHYTKLARGLHPELPHGTVATSPGSTSTPSRARSTGPR